METIVFGFPDADIHSLAATLARCLSIPLYQMHSPMIGVWYSSVDMAAAISALQQGAAVVPSTPQLTLERNDPEPGYTAPAFPGGDALLLHITGTECDLERIDQQLQDAALGAMRRR